MKLVHMLAFCLFGCAFALPSTNNTSQNTSDKLLTNASTNSTVDDLKFNFYHLNTNESLEKRIQLRQPRRPCACLDLNCGCCAGMEVQQFKRKLCTNFTYDPNEFQIQLDVMNNDQMVYQNSFSAKNPPPMCVPVPYTPASMCIKLFNIFTPGRNLHMCMDMEGKVQDKPYVVLHFDCMRMGQDGIKYPLKPEANGGEVGGGGGLFGLGLFGNRPSSSTQSPPETTDVAQVDTDIFDPVTEIKVKP